MDLSIDLSVGKSVYNLVGILWKYWNFQGANNITIISQHDNIMALQENQGENRKEKTLYKLTKKKVQKSGEKD